MAGYPPPYSPQGVDWKAQRRVWKEQARLQRQQYRMQRRALRRGSIVGPILLVALGVTFLLVEMGHLNWWYVTEWFGHWWPLLLIAAGVVLLAEWALDQHTQESRAAQGLPPVGSRRVGGGVIALLIFVAIFGGMAHVAARSVDWNNDNFRFGMGDWNHAFGDPHDSDDSMAQAIPADGFLTVDNPRGSVTVSGTSDDGQMHVAIHKQVFAFNTRDVDSRIRDLQPEISNDGGRLTVHVPRVESGHADLSIDVPRGVTLTVTSNHGDVRVSAMHAPVTVNANGDSVDLSGLTGPVVAHLHNDGVNFSVHSVTGPVTVDGRGGDVNVSDVHGDVSVGGSYSGKTHMERVDGAVHFQTFRTDFQMARLDGDLDLDTGSDLSADQLLGPVVLKTSARNITLERVQGNVQVKNRDGSVTLTSASPLGSVDVENHHGSVDVGVPASAGFTVKASTRHGDVENDFGLPKHGSDDSPELDGTVGKGGPAVLIETTDGDVTVRKSAVDPLPPVAPVAPKITTVPAVPVVPKTPHTPKAVKTPAAPVVPAAPKP
ncbi:MAG: DUF4097 family beta strand repeat-containing protein [Acidobacteriaceae bacterium]